MNGGACMLLVLILPFCAARANENLLSANAAPFSYKVRPWTVTDGLPQSRIQSIAQTRDGYLWVGTQRGLVRFEGVAFRPMLDAWAFDMERPAVPALAVDPNGSLWIGTTEGLFHRRDGQAVWITTTNGLPHRKVWKVLPTKGGEVWLETEAGLCMYKDGAFQPIGSSNGLPPGGVRDWAISPEGQLWIVNEVWMRRYNENARRFEPIPLSGLENIQGVCSLGFGKSGKIMLGTDHGLYLRHNEAWQYFDTQNGLGDSWVHSILEDSTETLWVITKNAALHRLNGDRFERVDLGIDGGEFSVDRIYEDREGNLWCATTDGLIQLRRQAVRALTTAQGLVDNRISTVYAAPDGSVWIGSEHGVSWVSPEGKVGAYRHPFPLSQSGFRGLSMDANERLWGGSMGLYQVNRMVEGIPRDAPHFPRCRIQSIFSARNGTLWVGTEKGIATYDGELPEWINAGRREGADVFLEDRAGRVWAGNSSGLHLIKGDSIRDYSDADGLLGGAANALLEDEDGGIWIGNERGLIRFKDGRFFSFRSANGLPDSAVRQILADDTGHIWLSGVRGIHRAARDDLVAVAEGRTNVAHFISFSEEDGMPSSECTGGIAPAGCRTRNGRLWFPTKKGVALIDPNQIVVNGLAPAVQIEQVKANEKIVAGDGAVPGIVLATAVGGARSAARSPLRIASADATVIEFLYTATSLSSPRKVRFQYKLEPRDIDWKDAQDRRVALYTDLRPGNYTFRVKACNNHGVWNEAGASISLVVTPRLTERASFYLLISATVLAGAVLTHRYRMKQSRHIHSLKHQLAFERERSRIAQDIHDDVGASLTRIQMLGQVLESDKSGSMEEYARKIATTARETAQRMDEIVWAVNPVNDTLASFVDYTCHAAQELLQPANIACRFELPPNGGDMGLSSEKRHAVFLLVREALHNVLKHSHATEVTLRIEPRGEVLLIGIEDNGCGFDLTSQHRGNGLRNLFSRAEALQGSCGLASQAGSGTKIEIRIPVP